MIAKSRQAAALVAFWWIASLATAQNVPFPNLRVEKKPGQASGSALVTIKGKNKVLASHAIQAWSVMNDQNAVVLVVAQGKKGGNKYHLRFYEGATRKYRDLGAMPFAASELIQGKQSDESWVFVLTGTYLEKPTIVLAEMNGIHGMLQNATAPQLHDDALTFLDANGNPKTLPIGPLIARDMTEIYQVTAPGSEKVRYAQFLRSGVAVLVGPDGRFHNAAWRTNGEAMIVTNTNGTEVRWPRPSLVPVTGVPAGTRLALRLLQPLSSERTKEGDAIEAVLISPATIDNVILIPQGSFLSGKVVKIHRLGWGMRRETAAMTIEFDSAKLPDGTLLSIHTRLADVENSRENVTESGMVKGVRSTGTPAYAAERKIASVASLDPVAYLFTSITSLATLGFADPEIRYPAGTEVLVQFLSPLITAKSYPRTVPEFPTSEAEQTSLHELVRSLPYRTMTQGSNKPSDLTTLVFIGPEEGLRRAFGAAGWTEADVLTASSKFTAIKAAGGNQVYKQAPMSTLLLDERPPVFSMAKTTNTFASRHHLRTFDPGMQYRGEKVLTASATQDIGVAFSYKQKTFIHLIDEYIDNERSKVVNDLEFTGCVEAMNLVSRPWVPLDAYNATGDRLRTDGAVAVMRISYCTDPRTTPSTPAKGSTGIKKGTRNTLLYLRDDLYRGNLIYTGINGAFKVSNYFATRDRLKPVAGAWRTTDQSGTQFKGVGDAPDVRALRQQFALPEASATSTAQAQSKELEDLHRWDPPRYEIGFQAAYMRYPVTRNELTLFAVVNNQDPTQTFVALFADEFDRGWSLGVSATLNSWKWFSNQFTYTYTNGVYEMAAAFSEPVNETFYGSTRILTRQFEYNLLWNLRPPKSRWRPYAAVGPALVLTHLRDAPLKKSAGPFKLGLQNIGLLLAAYDFGNKPPLDGGGVFSPGIVYGAGFKYRIHPRITWNVDFRETLSRAPNFLGGSYKDSYFQEQDYTLLQVTVSTDAKYRQQRLSTGFSFTF